MVYHNLNTDKLYDTHWRAHHLKDGGTAITICCPNRKNEEIQFEKLIAYRKSVKSEKYDWINKQYRQLQGDKTNG